MKKCLFLFLSLFDQTYFPFCLLNKVNKPLFPHQQVVSEYSMMGKKQNCFWSGTIPPLFSPHTHDHTDVFLEG